MRTITLEIDNDAGRVYDGLSTEGKQKFAAEASVLLKSTADIARAATLKKLVNDINNQKDCSYLNADILLELLPID
jgi:hypothetical protein